MNDDPELGPKMRGLTEKQRAFVMAMVEYPGITQGKAAELAGYSNSDLDHRVKGCQLMQDNRILEAIREVGGQLLVSSAILAQQTVVKLMSSPDEKIALKAAVALLDRGGHAVQQNININQTVTDNSGKAVMERIREIASKHGLDPQKLLAGKAPVVDAEFAEVKPGE